jgi:hypothetical protein
MDGEGARGRLYARLTTMAARHAADPLQDLTAPLHAQQRKALMAALTIAEVLVSQSLMPAAAQCLLTRLQALALGERQSGCWSLCYWDERLSPQVACSHY